MREILISTHTRHRDVNNPLYMRDWTAQDVKHVAPEGYYTSNKWGGAKRMGVILLIPDDVSLNFHKWTDQETLQMQDKFGERNQYWRRAKYWIDLTKLVEDGKLKDLYNHDLLVEPIVVNKSYLELFKSFEDRPTILSPHDKQGSFTSGTVNIGPGGDADANTLFEFESNIANLTDDLTGNVNEAFTETSQITLAGWTTGGHQFKAYTTGAARHAGVYTESKHFIDVSGSGIYCYENFIEDVIFEGFVSKSSGDTSWISVSGYGAPLMSKMITKVTGAAGGYYNMSGGEIWNCIAIGPGSGSAEGFRDGNYKNCTSYGFSKGFDPTTANNCVGRSQSDDFLGGTGDYNASDDGAPGGNSIDISGSSDAQIWTDVGAGDFSLVAGSPLRGNGFDYSGTFTEDINSVTRSAWDIGAWEYVAAGGATIDASAVDGITMSDIVGALGVYQVLSTDGFKMSDSNIALSTLSIIISDGFKMSDGNTVLATLLGSASDGIKMSDISLVNSILQTTATDGFKMSDAALIVTALFATASDGFKMSDSNSVLSTLLGNASDGFKMSDSNIALSTLLALATDGIKMSDLASTLIQMQAVSADGFKIGDTALRIITKFVTAVDGITMSDSGSVVMTLQAVALDGVKINDLATALATLLATASDGFKMADISIAVDITGLPNVVNITITGRTSSITFTVKSPSIILTNKIPGITWDVLE